jgi:hypothetical protein
MSLSKNLYRRMPYFIRKHLSRNQSFFVAVTVVVVILTFVFYEAVFGVIKTADDIYQESVAAKQLVIKTDAW